MVLLARNMLSSQVEYQNKMTAADFLVLNFNQDLARINQKNTATVVPLNTGKGWSKAPSGRWSESSTSVGRLSWQLAKSGGSR